MFYIPVSAADEIDAKSCIERRARTSNRPQIIGQSASRHRLSAGVESTVSSGQRSLLTARLHDRRSRQGLRIMGVKGMPKSRKT